MSTDVHYVKKCQHGVVVETCRCAAPEKRVIIVPCPPQCAAATTSKAEAAAEASVALQWLQQRLDTAKRAAYEGDGVVRLALTPSEAFECLAGLNAEAKRYAGAMWDALRDVATERRKQDEKWGEQNHQPVAWHPILMDAVCEAAKVDTKARCLGTDPRVFRDALVQVAVVAVEMIECGDRNGWWPR